MKVCRETVHSQQQQQQQPSTQKKKEKRLNSAPSCFPIDGCGETGLSLSAEQHRRLRQMENEAQRTATATRQETPSSGPAVLAKDTRCGGGAWSDVTLRRHGSKQRSCRERLKLKKKRSLTFCQRRNSTVLTRVSSFCCSSRLQQKGQRREVVDVAANIFWSE